MNLKPRLLCLAALSASVTASAESAPARPHVVFIFIDDMGYGDLSSTGNRDVSTTNMDRLATEGTLFKQFYVNSPICSPSRVAVTTGQYPARHLIHSYLAARRRNRERGMRDFLDPKAPSIARAFHDAGYATGHFGKWHMGGGRDVGEAPLPEAYGFDESLVSFEGLGDRILPPGGLSKQSAKLGRGTVTHVPKHRQTEIYVDRAIEFVRRQPGPPFYIHLWLNDVHDAHVPRGDRLKEFEKFSANPYVQKFYAVLAEMDHQIGRLIDAIDALGLAENTLILLTSDNGPTAWPSYYRQGYDPPGSTAGFRGRKWSLYEGGIRMPLIARWKGKIPAGRVDDTTVMAAIDLFPTLCSIAGVPPPAADFDGADLSAALLGQSIERRQPIFWEYGRDDSFLKPHLERDRSPNLAIREGRWKLLVRDDGTQLELYDFAKDTSETKSVAAEHPQVAKRLSEKLLSWRRSLPASPSAARKKPAELRDILGVTHVAGTYRLKEGDFLNEGVDQILRLGSRVVKLYLARPANDYPHGSEWAEAKSLVEMAKLPAYREVFSKPLVTYVLTAYRPGIGHHYWRRGVTDEERRDETREFYDLTRHLLATYRGTGKTFVLQHWEGDWAIRGSFEPNGVPPPEAIRGMIDWLNARQSGVDRARAEVADTDVKVYHALEVNRVVETLKTKHPGVTDQVLPHTTVDLVSYSAWDAQQDPVLLKKALDFIAARLPPKDVPLRKRVYIGEFGAPENDFTPEKVRSTVRGVVETGLEWGCPWIVYWQIYCNEARRRPVNANDDVRGFWLLRPDGTKTWAWEYLRGRIANRSRPAAGRRPENR